MNASLTQYPLWILLTGCFNAAAGAGEAVAAVEVFTDSQSPVVNAESTLTVYVVDGIARLQQDLSRDLPSDPAQAKAVVLTRLQQQNTPNHELGNAAQGLLRAQQYGLERYPAIVFDGRAVVYGVTDLHTAQQHYEQWRERAQR